MAHCCKHVHHKLKYNTTVAQETSAGNIYACGITPNDGIEDGVTKSSNNVTVVWNVTFNITSGEDGSQLNNVNIYCNNSWSVTGVSSPYSTGFLPGGYSCTFTELVTPYYNKTINFVADNDTIINVVLSLRWYLTTQEHGWLESIYNRIENIEKKIENISETTAQINQTVNKIWNQYKRTDQSIVTNETKLSLVVNATSNLTIFYKLRVPSKEGYGPDDFLPIRVSYWFLDKANTTCYNQAKQIFNAENPYCNPLIAQTIGQINREINFTVDLRPALPVGDYTIVRNIEIDPNQIWINYGQEVIGNLVMLESNSEPLVNVKKAIPEVVKIAVETAPQATGGITGLFTLIGGAENVSLFFIIMTFGLVAYSIFIRDLKKRTK